jgi:transposase
MNEFKTFIGIDISKKTFDAAILRLSAPNVYVHQCFSQSKEGYKSFLQWLQEQDVVINNEVLICMEHTGIYINGVVEYLAAINATIWVEMPLRIKKSMGLQRGTDDRLASISIAQYAFRFRDLAKLWKPADAAIEQLRHLVAQRDRLVSSITQLSVPVNELKDSGNIIQARELSKLQSPAIKGLEKSLRQLEKTIDSYIDKDAKTKEIIGQVSSVKGVGKQTAMALYVYTRGFTMFENAKQLACYCGVVPFSKSSGTSVRYKPGVSPYANRKLKKLLHLCAMAALRHDAEIREYYLRKVLEGKNKMSVINAIRNKLVHRIFAVVRENRLYVDNYTKLCA